jgi:hypothetical protein
MWCDDCERTFYSPRRTFDHIANSHGKLIMVTATFCPLCGMNQELYPI